MEGHVGRTAMDLIESGHCALGPTTSYDAYDNPIPGRDDVVPGSKGSVEYVENHGNTVQDGES